jgi:hypothetical protein
LALNPDELLKIVTTIQGQLSKTLLSFHEQLKKYDDRELETIVVNTLAHFLYHISKDMYGEEFTTRHIALVSTISNVAILNLTSTIEKPTTH